MPIYILKNTRYYILTNEVNAILWHNEEGQDEDAEPIYRSVYDLSQAAERNGAKPSFFRIITHGGE